MYTGARGKYYALPELAFFGILGLTADVASNNLQLDPGQNVCVCVCVCVWCLHYPDIKPDIILF